MRQDVRWSANNAIIAMHTCQPSTTAIIRRRCAGSRERKMNKKAAHLLLEIAAITKDSTHVEIVEDG